MSDWKLVELFIKRSNATGRAYAVGIAIAHLGNRHDDGWTFGSLPLVAQLSRLDRRTANLAILDLEEIGELEYERGRSSFNLSRYRIRADVLQSGRDRSRRQPTMDDSPLVTSGDSHLVTSGDSDVDWRRLRPSLAVNHPVTSGESPPVSIKSSYQSIYQISDQSAREENPRDHDDDAPTNVGPDQKHSDVGDLKTVLEDCRRAAHGSAGEEQ
jgi:hypothetical protein